MVCVRGDEASSTELERESPEVLSVASARVPSLEDSEASPPDVPSAEDVPSADGLDSALAVGVVGSVDTVVSSETVLVDGDVSFEGVADSVDVLCVAVAVAATSSAAVPACSSVVPAEAKGAVGSVSRIGSLNGPPFPPGVTFRPGLAANRVGKCWFPDEAVGNLRIRPISGGRTP